MFINGDITNHVISEVISFTLIQLQQIVRRVRKDAKRELVEYKWTLSDKDLGSHLRRPKFPILLFKEKAKAPHHWECVLYGDIPSVRVSSTNMDSLSMQLPARLCSQMEIRDMLRKGGSTH